jgi:hypothetical protein
MISLLVSLRLATPSPIHVQMVIAYKDNGWHAFTSLCLFPKAALGTFVGDSDMIKEIANDRVRFPKPIDSMKMLQVYGLVRHFALFFLQEW